jgi:hypothetical protein
MKRKRRSGPLENPIHVYAVQALKLLGVPGLIWFHVPNEGKRSVRTGAFLKRMGMLPGVADLVVIVPPGRCHFLELKRPINGHLSDEQRAFRDLCERNCSPYSIATSPLEVEVVLSNWGAIRTTMPMRRMIAA